VVAIATPEHASEVESLSKVVSEPRVAGMKGAGACPDGIGDTAM
jgi:hypothetical protein